MNKNVICVGLGLLALYLLTRKKDILKSAEVKTDTPPVVIGQPVEKPLPPKPMPEVVSQMPTQEDSFFGDLFTKPVNDDSIPCPNNPDKSYSPSTKYIVDPCKDYEKPLPPTPMPEAFDWMNSDWFKENVIIM